MTTRQREFVVHVGVFTLFVALTVAMTWPLGAHIGEGFIGVANYWDAWTNSMIMTARSEALLGSDAIGLRDSYYFAPVSPSMVFNENLFGLTLIYLVPYLLTGSPIFAYNVVLLLSLAGSGFTMWLLVRHLSGSGPAGIISGVLYAFCAYVFFQMGRIQLVAIQWIPLCYYFALRVVETARWRHAIGLSVAFLLQVGSCLYYAMFLIPTLTLLIGWSVWTRRPKREFWIRLGVSGSVAGGIALAIMAPYLSARHSFGLHWDLDYLTSHGGRIADLGHVFKHNQLLESLHYAVRLNIGQEEVAFPGFTTAILAALGLLLVMYRALFTRATAFWRAPAMRCLGLWLGAVALAVLATLAVSDATIAVPIALVAALVAHKRRWARDLPAYLGLFVVLTAVQLVLWLGYELFEFQGEPIRGLYANLVDFVPGFNSMRKVARQAILLQASLCVLAGLGFAALTRRAPHGAAAILLAVICAGTSLAEQRNAPLPIRERNISSAYQWLAEQDDVTTLAVLPSRAGRRDFRGTRGGSLHNLHSTVHRHRMVTGRSTWVPPFTAQLDKEARRFPRSDALMFWQIAGVSHLVVHKHDLGKRARGISRFLQEAPERYQLVNGGKEVDVYRLLPPSTAPELLSTPVLPPGATPITPRGATAKSNGSKASHALDQALGSSWRAKGLQREGQWFQIDLGDEQDVVALEFANHANVFDAPRAWRLELSGDGKAWTTAQEQVNPALFAGQIHTPASFVFRVVLPEARRARYVRLSLLAPSRTSHWVVHTARVWAP